MIHSNLNRFLVRRNEKVQCFPLMILNIGRVSLQNTAAYDYKDYLTFLGILLRFRFSQNSAFPKTLFFAANRRKTYDVYTKHMMSQPNQTNHIRFTVRLSIIVEAIRHTYIK